MYYNFYNFLFDTTTWSQFRNTQHCSWHLSGSLKNGQINQGGVGSHNQRDYLKNASSKGVKLINVSPLKSDLETINEVEWIQLNPTQMLLDAISCYEIYKSAKIESSR